MTTNLSLRAGVRGPVATSQHLKDGDPDLGSRRHSVSNGVGLHLWGSLVDAAVKEGAELVPDGLRVGDALHLDGVLDVGVLVTSGRVFDE